MRSQPSISASLLLASLPWISSCSETEASSASSPSEVATNEAHGSELQVEPASPTEATGPVAARDEIKPAPDAPLTDSQIALLDLAYGAASKFPLQPHIKNRSRAQEAVVDASFELNAPGRAIDYNQGIENWRKAFGYAKYALYFGERGDEAIVTEFSRRAIALGDLSEGWRKQRVYSTVAKAHLAIGKYEEASSYAQGLEPGEAESVDVARAASAEGEEDYENHIAWIAAAFDKGSFEQVREALVACEKLYGQYFVEEERRDELEEMVLTNMSKAPRDMAISALLGMARAAIDHDDLGKGAEFAQHAVDNIRGAPWAPEDEIPLEARAAEVFHLAGRKEVAVRTLDEMLAKFKSSRDAIVDINRADALIPLAEAYAGIGEGQKAHEVYARAVEEAVLNPNSRPRVDDLVAACCSMAVHGVEPSEKFWERLRKIDAGLGDPW